MKGHNYGKCRRCGKIHIHHFSGKKFTNEHRLKMKEGKKKMLRTKKGKLWKKKNSEWHKENCKAEKNPNWKGGKISFFRSKAKKVIKKSLGIKIKHPICVHHINGDITDNRKENLLVCTRSYHTEIHHKQRKVMKNSFCGKI